MTDKERNTYKTIGEVAEMLGLFNEKNGKLTTHTIRFWEKEFKQIKPKIFSGRRRYYDSKSIEILKRIKFLLKDKGMTIKGVKKMLNSDLDEIDNKFINTKNILKSKISKISKIVNEIKEVD